MTRDSDGNRNGEDAQRLSAKHDSAGRQASPQSQDRSTPMTTNKPINPDSDESAIVRVRIAALTAPLSDSLAADMERVCNLAMSSASPAQEGLVEALQATLDHLSAKGHAMTLEEARLHDMLLATLSNTAEGVKP